MGRVFARAHQRGRGSAAVPAPARVSYPGPVARAAAVGSMVTGLRVQPKLRVGAPDDRYEREADQVADRVMRMPEAAVQRMCTDCGEEQLQRQPIEEEEEMLQTKPLVQRMCTECEEEQQQLQRQPLEEEEEMLQAKGFAGGEPRVAPQTESEIRSLPPGRPLGSAEREFFEPRLGADLGGVRLHSGPRAEQLASAVDARAFTYGRDVVFGRGHSAGQRHLLAHELVHTVQQGAAPPRGDHAASAGSPAAAGSIQRTVTGCTDQSRIDAAEAAQSAARGRAQNAAFKTKGIVPPGPPGRGDPAEEARRRARRIARTIFGEDLNMEQVGDIVSDMGSRLANSSLPLTCAAANDPHCGSRAAYVVGNRAPVFLCENFFTGTNDEGRIRTMVHEAAHLAGIGEAVGESYCAFYDCETSCGGFDVADSWAHYVNCVTSQTPDQPTTIRGGTP